MIRRRDFIQSAVLSTLAVPTLLEAAQQRVTTESRPFDFAVLKGQARALSVAAYQAPQTLASEALTRLDYDQYQSIRFRRDQALWGREERGFRIEFFHMGRGFKEPVRMYEVAAGQAREIRYSAGMFDMGRSGVDARSLGSGLGFAGFRVHAATNWDADVAAFLGAAYFRAVGSDTRQFGLSARGLAIDTVNGTEEFPRFTSFWFERPGIDSRTLVLYALMDTPSATGAYRFALTPGAPQTMEVDSAIYPRKSISRLGIAPLTSMFQCGENDKRVATDWRPEIHDSDGLSMNTGSGEWIWRPITNPPLVHFSSFADENPRGFGLLQRDREFSNYQDDGVYYHRRPSLWIEPKAGPKGAGWGKGSVQLAEIPTIDETFDNIVAFWNPAEPPKAGDELLFAYRMYWGTRMPYVAPLAHVVATRTGIGGVIGQKRKYFSWRFAIDFVGGELQGLAPQTAVDAIVSASRGAVELVSARPLAPLNGYRAMFDLKLTDDGVDPIELRLQLKTHGQVLTETWMYQWTPPSIKDRRAILTASGS